MPLNYIDSNSAVLTASNTVTLIKYLSVGGWWFYGQPRNRRPKHFTGTRKRRTH